MQKTQKEGSYGLKNALFSTPRASSCRFVPFRAQNCLFWPSFAGKNQSDTGMCRENMNKLNSKNSLRARQNASIIGPTKCPNHTNWFLEGARFKKTSDKHASARQYASE
jgi:hypothetical protein